MAAAILAELPQWFGRSAATEAYVQRAETRPTFVARAHSRAVGLLSVCDHFGLQSEIAVMGVLPDHHRRGIGRRLVEASAQRARDRGADYLSVKTLGPDHDDPGYAGTRAFYTAMEFLPFETLDGLWGPQTSCLLMIRKLS